MLNAILATARRFVGSVATLDETLDEQAVRLAKQSLEQSIKENGVDHPHTAAFLCHLASLYKDQGKCAEAELLYKRALAIGEQSLGPDHPNNVAARNHLARMRAEQVDKSKAK